MDRFALSLTLLRSRNQSREKVTCTASPTALAAYRVLACNTALPCWRVTMLSSICPVRTPKNALRPTGSDTFAVISTRARSEATAAAVRAWIIINARYRRGARASNQHLSDKVIPCGKTLLRQKKCARCPSGDQAHKKEQWRASVCRTRVVGFKLQQSSFLAPRWGLGKLIVETRPGKHCCSRFCTYPVPHMPSFRYTERESYHEALLCWHPGP